MHQSEEKFVKLFFISVLQFVSYLHTSIHPSIHPSIYTYTHIHTNKTLGRRRLTLSTPGYICLIMLWAVAHSGPLFPRINPDRKTLLTFGTAILCNVITKIMEKKFQNCSYRDYGTTNYVNVFGKLCKKWLKYIFFSKINLVAAIKKVLKVFFQLLKVKITSNFFQNVQSLGFWNFDF